MFPQLVTIVLSLAGRSNDAPHSSGAILGDLAAHNAAKIRYWLCTFLVCFRVGFFLLDGIVPGIILQSPGIQPEGDPGIQLEGGAESCLQLVQQLFSGWLIWSCLYFPETTVVQPGGMGALCLQPTQHLVGWLVLWIGFPLCRNCSRGRSVQHRKSI